MITWLRRFARWLQQPNAGAVLSHELVQEFSQLRTLLGDIRAEVDAVRGQLHALEEKLSWADVWPADRESGGGAMAKSTCPQANPRLKMPRKPGDLASLQRKMWFAVLHAQALLEDEDASPDQRRAAVHALSQASLAYLKVLDATDVEQRMQALEVKFGLRQP